MAFILGSKDSFREAKSMAYMQVSVGVWIRKSNHERLLRVIGSHFKGFGFLPHLLHCNFVGSKVISLSEALVSLVNVHVRHALRCLRHRLAATRPDIFVDPRLCVFVRREDRNRYDIDSDIPLQSKDRTDIVAAVGW